MHIIELSTVAFYDGHTPRSLALHECSLPLASPVPGALSALYGTKSKPEGFMAARAYADRHRLQFTVIDFLVALEHKPNASVMKPDELPDHDFLSLLRISGSMSDQVGEWLRAGLEEAGQSAELLDSLKAEQAVLQQPSLVGALLNKRACRHLKLIAFPAMTAISDRPLNVGSVPFRHWSAIQEATCRLDPTVRVTLDPPPAQLATKALKTAPAKRPSKPKAG
jgi:hypothetical protein